MNLVQFRDILNTISPNVHHYEASKEKGNYIVWAEEGEGSNLWADNKKIEQCITGTIDYFTKDEFDPLVNTIQDTLTNNEISWSLNSIQYEKETGYTHYEWVWEVDSLG